MVELLCHTATVENIFGFCFSHCPPCLSRLLPLRTFTFNYFFKGVNGLTAAFIFCGGKAVAAMPLFRARLFPRRLPPHPRTPARARADARVLLTPE
jgi:hypothetical protein